MKHNKNGGIMKMLLVSLALCMCMPLILGADVRINGVGTTYTTIQAAITNASPGDFITITTGVYEESVNIFNTELTLEGGYDPTFTNQIGLSTIDGFWSGLVSPGSIIDITNSTVTLNSLEITDGGFGAFTLSGYGGGIDARAGSAVLVEDCLIHDNFAKGYGGGIYVNDSYLELNDSPVYDNRASAGLMITPSGGGIAVVDGEVLLSGSTTDIDNNFAEEGGGVWVNNGMFTASNNSDMEGNIAIKKGGGILLMNNSTGIVTDSATIIGTNPALMNSATNGSGGGIYVEDSHFELVNRASLWCNYASENGGGVYMTNSTMLLDNAYIGYNNNADCTNYADGYGGGVYMLHSHLVLTNNAYICRCYANFGGAIFAQNSFIEAYDGACIGYRNGFAGNSAITCGGILSLESSLNFHNTTIKDNFGDNVCGALYALGTGDYYFSRCDIVNNASSGSVGAILAQVLDGEFIIDATDIISNTAAATVGGVYYISVSPLIMQNGSRLSFNTAEDVGGMQLAGTAYVHNAEISMNGAERNAGGVYILGSGSYFECKDTDLIGNYAGTASGTTNSFAGAAALFGCGARFIAENRSIDIMGNRAGDGAALFAGSGADVYCIAKPPYAINIQDNTALESGAGLWLEESHALLSGNVRLDGNTAKYGAGIYATNYVHVTATADSGYMPEIVNNHAFESGAGIYARASNTVITLSNTFIGMPGEGNVADAQSGSFKGGGGAYIGQFAQLHAVNCQFIDNISSNIAGALLAVLGAEVYINGDFTTASALPPNTFLNNRAKAVGGAVALYASSRLDMRDVGVISNSAPNVGGIMLSMSSTANVVNAVCTHNFSSYYPAVLACEIFSGALMRHCTIANNATNALMSVNSNPIDMQNCIIWGNIGDMILTNCTATFCDIQGGYPGSFNITNDPLFVNSAGLNYQLLAASPCIDNGATLLSVTNDCIGNPRPYDGGWDIGAYEFVPEPSSLFIVLIALVWRIRKK